MNALVLPPSLLAEAGAFFETCGAHGLEGTALIANGPLGPRLVIPDQWPIRSAQGGVSVTLAPAGVLQLARDLGADELYAARIHSHPEEAFHSATDDANPVLQFDGALSIVVPYFGLGLRRGLAACAVLRFEGGRWRDLPTGSARDMWIRLREAP